MIAVVLRLTEDLNAGTNLKQKTVRLTVLARLESVVCRSADTSRVKQKERTNH